MVGPHGRDIGAHLFGSTWWWHPVPPGLTLFDDGGADAPPSLPAASSRFVSCASRGERPPGAAGQGDVASSGAADVPTSRRSGTNHMIATAAYRA